MLAIWLVVSDLVISDKWSPRAKEFKINEDKL